MPTLREQIAAKVAPTLAPIAGAQPVGVDPSYDPDFERIKGEIDKLTSVDGREPAWRDVRDVGLELLSRRSKDLRVAGWVGAAQIKLDGWSGLAEWLVTYDGLVRAYWDTMFPDAKRLRARLSAFTWLAELAGKHLSGLDVSASDGEAVRASDEALRALEQLLTDKVGESFPGAGPLRRIIREKLAAIPDPAVTSQFAAATPQTPAPSDAPAASPEPALRAEIAPQDSALRADSAPRTEATPPTAAASSADVDGAVQESVQALFRAASAIRAVEPTRGQAYRLQRWGAWASVQNTPVAEGGKTRVRAPPEPLLRRLSVLREGQRWMDLLVAAEEATGRFLFWLDLHRAVALAMDRLGPTFAEAREVVGREVVAFVGRIPSVPSLAFSDGTPFADSSTKSWLDEETKRYAGGGASAAGAAVSAEDEEVTARFAAAEALVDSGKIAEGLALASALASRGADGRARFRSGVALGKMALKASRPEVARAILERLAADADRRGLDEWEPALCASLYGALLSAARDASTREAPSRPKASPGASLPESVAREQAIFDTLCRLDPAAALKFASG